MIGMRGDPAEFEAWLLSEIPVQARIANKHQKEGGKGFPDGLASGYAHALIVTLGRYADRDPNVIWKVADDPDALRRYIRNGPSHQERLERQVAKALKNEGDYACRGCAGTCCTGVGSDPCTCPPPGSGDN